MDYYVERNVQGDIIGVYANPQTNANGVFRTDPSPLPADHASVVAFLNKPETEASIALKQQFSEGE